MTDVNASKAVKATSWLHDIAKKYNKNLMWDFKSFTTQKCEKKLSNLN